MQVGIEAQRRLSRQFWRNDATIEAGREALGFHREKRDDLRRVGRPVLNYAIAIG